MLSLFSVTRSSTRYCHLLESHQVRSKSSLSSVKHGLRQEISNRRFDERVKSDTRSPGRTSSRRGNDLSAREDPDDNVFSAKSRSSPGRAFSDQSSKHNYGSRSDYGGYEKPSSREDKDDYAPSERRSYDRNPTESNRYPSLELKSRGKSSSGRGDFPSQDRKPYDRSSRRQGDDFPSQDHDRSSSGRPRYPSLDFKARGETSAGRGGFSDRAESSFRDRKPFDRTTSSGRGDFSSRSESSFRDRKPVDRTSAGRDDFQKQDRQSFDRPSGRGDFSSRDRKSFDRPFGRSDFQTRDRRSYDRSSPRQNDERRETQLSFRRDREPYDQTSSRGWNGEVSEAQSSFRRSAPRADDGDVGFDDMSSKARDAYISIPYTTAASEFLYGANVVTAALKSRRRTLHTLYLHRRSIRRAEQDEENKGLSSLAVSAGVTIKRVDNDFLPVMDKITEGRPHNGVILEASPLPVPPVEQLGKVQADRQTPLMMSQTQTAEERALHGTTQFLDAPAEPWRQPFVLMLDGILDPGNLGNILRTAYFYGVDAVAICVNTCAPLKSPVLHKAASGATEALKILAIQRPADFAAMSARNGWRVHAAVAPGGANQYATNRSTFSTNKMVSPLTRAPSILMMGAEGEGLRQNLKNKASHNVIIAGGQKRTDDDLGVDSLNVSAATAVLAEAFMRTPVEARQRGAERQASSEGEDTEKVLADDAEDAEKLF